MLVRAGKPRQIKNQLPVSIQSKRKRFKAVAASPEAAAETHKTWMGRGAGLHPALWARRDPTVILL
jgi:hypothetical protein